MPTGIPRVPAPFEWVRTKRCSACRQLKPWAKFSPRAYFEDGTVRAVTARCHECAVRYKSERGFPSFRELSPERQEYLTAYWHRRWHQRKRDRAGYGGLLPAAPFLAWLNEQDEAKEDNWTILAGRLGVNDRSLRRVRTQESVSLDIVDRALANSGLHLHDLYPELQDSEAA